MFSNIPASSCEIILVKLVSQGILDGLTSNDLLKRQGNYYYIGFVQILLNQYFDNINRNPPSPSPKC